VSFLILYVFLFIHQGNEKMEELVDINNIIDDDLANLCNDDMLNNYLNGKQNLTS